MGVLYTWFHVYRPMGPNPNPDLCLSPEQALRAAASSSRCGRKKPIVIIDAYHDGDGKALCPAANGISHHINPWGGIEPCPIVQFSTESIHSTPDDPRPLKEKFLSIRPSSPTSGSSRPRRRAAASSSNGRTS